MKLKKPEIEAKRGLCAYLDTVRHGRNHKPLLALSELSSLLKKEDLNRKSLKEGSRHTFQVQESSPDVGYSPFG